jgi:hypothetical protein
MKKLIIAVAALMVSIAAYGQGQFVFNNRVLPDVNARFIANTDPAAGTSSIIGTDYTVQLFNGTAALDPASTTFRGAAGTAAAGYVTPTTETVAGLAPGATANITLKVVGPNITGGSQTFGPYSVALGGGTVTPPNLPLGTTPLTVTLGAIPEPTTLALGFLGLGALGLAIRRRN